MNLINTFRNLGRTRLIAAVLVIAVVAATSGYYWWKTTPQYALAEIRKAYETHDVDLALKYIDVDSVFDNLWTEIQQQITQKAAESSNGWEALGAMIGQSLVANMKPTIKENLRTQLIDSIKNATTTTSLQEVATHYSIRHDGSLVIVESDSSSIKFQLKKSDQGYWRVVAIEGLSQSSGIGAEKSTSSQLKSTTTDKVVAGAIPAPTPATKKASTPVPKLSPPEETQLPKSEPVSPPPSQITTSTIPGLAAIRIGGGIWENWNADMANDGPSIYLVYLDSSGDIISDNSVKKLPISADVKVYTTDTSSISYNEGRMVFSAHYSPNQIILGNIYPKIRIPKEQMSVNPSVDYQYGYVSVAIHTPEQGDFSAKSDFLMLYEK